MAYLKPQSPIKYNEDHIYPLTTVDQIIMNDGNRLSGVGVYLEKPEESDDTTTETGVNADTLGGILPSDFVLDSELDSYKTEVSNSYLSKTGTAANSTKLNNYTFDALKSYMLDLAHPIGSYYWSSSSTNPASLFGGTWVQIKDKFVLAAGDSYAVGNTGGASTVSFTPSGTNAGTAITAAQMPKHRHTTHIWNNAGTKANAKTTTNYGAGTTDATLGLSGNWGSWQSSTFQAAQSGFGDQNGITDISGGGQTHTHTFTGKSQTINKMPPYLVAYCWRRTA